MSELDKYDKETAEMLPCGPQCGGGVHVAIFKGPHLDGFLYGACLRRPAVAARLRSDGAEIEQLRTLDKTMAKAHNSNLVEMANMREEIAQLRAQLVEALAGRDAQRGKAKYVPQQMRLLNRLANQIGNEGTLFHEIASEFKDACYQGVELAQLQAQLVALHGKIMNLPVTKEHLLEPRDAWSRGYRLGHRDARHAAAELCAGMGSADVR